MKGWRGPRSVRHHSLIAIERLLSAMRLCRRRPRVESTHGKGRRRLRTLSVACSLWANSSEELSLPVCYFFRSLSVMLLTHLSASRSAFGVLSRRVIRSAWAKRLPGSDLFDHFPISSVIARAVLHRSTVRKTISARRCADNDAFSLIGPSDWSAGRN
jgi:hypothetical protein